MAARRPVSWLCGPAAVLVLCATVLAASPKKPHILMIVGDDYGYNDIGYHQNTETLVNPEGLPTTENLIHTPNLDLLSSQGLRLESMYVQPLCSPTRGTFMTGRYPSHTGVGPDVIMLFHPYGMPGRETMLPEKMKEAGYATHMIGKWHLGFCDEHYMGTYRGFDSFLGYQSGAEGYFSHSNGGLDFRNGSHAEQIPPALKDEGGNYSTLIFTSEAQRIIERHDPEQPFFLYLAFQAVHNPLQAPDHYINQYPDIKDIGRRTYAGMVKAMDEGIGNITATLKAKGMWDDTLIVFTTDNGGEPSSLGRGNNFPLRGVKVYNWEGGVRGTAFMRGTNSDLAPLPTGYRSQLMHSTDWFPTLCHVVGVDPEGRNKLPLDGVNQWEVFREDAPTNRSFVIHNVPVRVEKQGSTTNTCAVAPSVGNCSTFGVTGGAIRVGDWKLLTAGVSTPTGMRQIPVPDFTPEQNLTVPEPFNKTYWLFNISADPTESNNLAGTRADVLDMMLEFYDEYAKTAVPDIAWTYGFPDPARFPKLRPDDTWGPFVDSEYCKFSPV